MISWATEAGTGEDLRPSETRPTRILAIFRLSSSHSVYYENSRPVNPAAPTATTSDSISTENLLPYWKTIQKSVSGSRYRVLEQ